MRGGRFQAKSNEDANVRNAEALFETRTVVEIREVEAHTRDEIEEKKEELRQLVGASYRDLIESADSISLIKQSCQAVVANIGKMEGGFEDLKRSVTVNVLTPAADIERKRRGSLYEVGSRVKYLVDTPEKIWGCLDEHMYLEGAERYLRAKEVHSILTGIGAKEELLGRFPLLRQQWTLIERFRGQISKRSKDRLQEPGLSLVNYAVALAACGIIDELNSSQVFALSLESCKLWLRSHLRAWVQGRNSGDNREGIDIATDVATSLCKLMHMIQTSVCQIGVLFLEVSTGKMPLLYSTVLAAPPGSQLFGGIPNPEMEVAAWKKYREKLESSMVSLTGSYISDACVWWLKDCAEEIAVESRPLIALLKTGKGLADVESLVRDGMNKQDALAESLDWLQGTFGKFIDSPWDCLCELLLKAPTNLWDKLFEELFTNQMKVIINGGFEKINVKEMIDNCLEVIGPTAAVEGTKKKQVSTADASRIVLQELDPNYDGKLHWKSGNVETEWDGDARFFFTPEVTNVRHKVDESLNLILQDLVSFLQGPHMQVRTDLVAPYLQEQCFRWVSSTTLVIETRLLKLSENMAKAATEALNLSVESPKQVLEVNSHSRPVSKSGINIHASKTGNTSKVFEQALFLGRLSAALGEHSTSLPSLLGSSSWNTPLRQTSTKVPYQMTRQSLWSETNSSFEGSVKRSSRRGVRDTSLPTSDDGGAKLRELRSGLRQQSIAAHQIWIRWSTDNLSGNLLRDLHLDECLSTLTPLKGWEETVIKSIGDEAEEVDAHISVPAMPSPYVVAFLFAGCQKIHRIGDHVLDRAVLELFAWELLEKVLIIYEKFMSHLSFMNSRVSEKGLLQLLFDLKFLADVLSGGEEVRIESLSVIGTEDLTPSSALKKATSLKADIGRKRWVDKLLNDLHNRIDPIDWATYESYLWEQERRYYRSCAVLFGSLIQLKRLHTDVPQKLMSTGDSNTLNMSATVPRFTYLPISDDVSTFSLSDSPSQNSQGSAKLLQQLMGVGTKLGEGTLGKLLSDGQVNRFKDKSAAAISTFGDMLPAQAAGLFSSIGSAMKQDSHNTIYY
nr:conserved oligomeric Golgi complex subunit 1-like [Physcomitrium patens]|eukprot:XP_024403110.1 conserved oligomeric Golgi complex subunit 1-like [Physcomitrella patens]